MRAKQNPSCRFLLRLALALAVLMAGAQPDAVGGIVRTRDGRTLEGDLGFNEAEALVVTPASGRSDTVQLREVLSASFAQGSFLSSGSMLPNGWTATDLGDVRGFSRLDSNTITLRVEGRSTNALACHYVSRPMPSDGDMFVRVDEIGGPAETSAGLMIRAQNSAVFAAISVRGDGRLSFDRRTDPDRKEVRSTIGPKASVPVHLRLQKFGRTIRALHSPDGKDWKELAADSVKILPEKTWREGEGDLHLLRATCGVFAGNTRPGSTGTARIRLQIMTQQGLLGEYFAGRDLSNLKMARVDPQLRFNWREGAPDPAVGSNDFSIRWTGKLLPPRSTTYYFYSDTEDTVRLWVDGREVQPTPFGSSRRDENAAAAQLIGGRPTEIKVEFEERDGAAEFKLGWAVHRQKPEVIPMTNFMHYFVGAKSPESIALARFTNSGPGVRGIMLRNGSFIAGTVSKADESAVYVFLAGKKDTPVLNNRVARIVVRPPRQALPYEITHGRNGVFMRNGDFFESDFRGIQYNTLTVSSVLFGLKRYSIDNGEPLVVILNDVTPVRTGFEVRLLDGSVIMASRLQAGPAVIQIEDSILGPLTVPVGELVEIRALGVAAAVTAP